LIESGAFFYLQLFKDIFKPIITYQKQLYILDLIKDKNQRIHLMLKGFFTYAYDQRLFLRILTNQIVQVIFFLMINGSFR